MKTSNFFIISTGIYFYCSLVSFLSNRIINSKPTRVDYSATTGSQTARHNATHALDTKRPKSILHSKKISVAFQSHDWLHKMDRI